MALRRVEWLSRLNRVARTKGAEHVGHRAPAGGTDRPHADRDDESSGGEERAEFGDARRHGRRLGAAERRRRPAQCGAHRRRGIVLHRHGSEGCRRRQRAPEPLRGSLGRRPRPALEGLASTPPAAQAADRRSRGPRRGRRHRDPAGNARSGGRRERHVRRVRGASRPVPRWREHGAVATPDRLHSGHGDAAHRSRLHRRRSARHRPDRTRRPRRAGLAEGVGVGRVDQRQRTAGPTTPTCIGRRCSATSGCASR